MSERVAEVDAKGYASILTLKEMAEKQSRLLHQRQQEEEIVRSRLEQKLEGMRVPPEFHLQADANHQGCHWVPNCPSCGNNDTRDESTGSILPITKYASSGWVMKCLACGAENWDFFVPPMQCFWASPKPAENALKVDLSWDMETWM